MKKRFLPISLLLTIIILAQTTFAVKANTESGEYTPRTSEQATAQSFMKSIRANQETGLIDPAWLVATKDSQLRTAGELDWTTLGPDNYGSLTRGIVYDKNDANTIYIGTMGGGVFQSVNGGITWKTIGQNLMVNCMAQTEDNTIFIGTGDGRNAQNINGLSDLNYETSFVGSGLYKLSNNAITVIEGTKEWSFVNDIATKGNVVYAATSEGIYKYESNKLSKIEIKVDTASYTNAIVHGIEVCPDGTILAVVGEDVCMIDAKGVATILTDGQEGKLPKVTDYKIIAVSPSDANYMYVSFLTKRNSGTGDIYMTSDHGKTWQVAYTSTNMHDIYGSRGVYDNAMVVYPNDPRKVLIGGIDLWVLRDIYGEGNYRIECISSGSGFQISQGVYNYKYVHSGIQAITFNPNNQNEFFVGTEGGVFKGSYSSNGYLFEGANRYFETEEKHVSVSRMFSVAFSGENDRVIGGSLEHGTINVYGFADVNNPTTGNGVFPNDNTSTNASATYGAYDFTKAGGPCAMSSLDPNIMFITTTGQHSIGTPILRTQTSGVDFDKDNFSYSVTDGSAILENRNAFRTPIVLFENFNDAKSVDSVKYYIRPHVTMKGEKAKVDTKFPVGYTFNNVLSSNASYPFDYTLAEADMNGKDTLMVGDSIFVKDIISTTFIAALEEKVVMTKDALKFNKVLKEKDWFVLLSAPKGIPSALTISADGDVAYVGTMKGVLYRIEGVSNVATKNSISIVNSASVITKTVIDSTFNGQAITSISIDPTNSNNVMVTLGNYGNENYVFYATDGKTFTALKNAPAGPVYSSLIANCGENKVKYLLGTEKGLFTSDDMQTWTADANIKDVPVMEIKQQLLANRDSRYTYLVDEIGEITRTEYPSISNNNVIYIATYGRGLYKCANFAKAKPAEDIEENIISSAKELEMNIYPNPVVSEATVNFNVEESATVSYQIFDLSGRMVKDETLGNYEQGTHTANFNVDGLTSGSYIVKVQAGNVSKTSKILVY